jgi:hypothetical protein
MQTKAILEANYQVALPNKQKSPLLILILGALILSISGCGGQEKTSATSKSVMSNILGLIGISPRAADNLIGKPYKTEETPVQESVPRLPSGGEMRYYDYDGYDISIQFDKQEQISKAVFILGGLATREYTLDDANGLLDTLGIHVTSAADFATDNAATWYEYNGFQIYLALGYKTGDHQYKRGGTYIDRVYIAQLP